METDVGGGIWAHTGGEPPLVAAPAGPSGKKLSQALAPGVPGSLLPHHIQAPVYLQPQDVWSEQAKGRLSVKSRLMHPITRTIKFCQKKKSIIPVSLF